MNDLSKIASQQRLDKLLQQHGDIVLKNLAKACVDVNDGTYYLCGLTHDTMRMLYSIINKNMDNQQAKAAFKVAIDTVLLDYGMSVAIHEFS
jgi:hypothetical protein